MTKLKEEFFKIVPPTIYFLVALHIVMFIRVLMLEGTGLSRSSSISIAVAALILSEALTSRPQGSPPFKASGQSETMSEA